MSAALHRAAHALHGVAHAVLHNALHVGVALARGALAGVAFHELGDDARHTALDATLVTLLLSVPGVVRVLARRAERRRRSLAPPRVAAPSSYVGWE